MLLRSTGATEPSDAAQALRDAGYTVFASPLGPFPSEDLAPVVAITKGDMFMAKEANDWPESYLESYVRFRGQSFSVAPTLLTIAEQTQPYPSSEDLSFYVEDGAGRLHFMLTNNVPGREANLWDVDFEISGPNGETYSKAADPGIWTRALSDPAHAT
ncbi:MAG: hypothetical protein V3V08_06520 [Nannocystaceae bacterium]